MRGARSTAVVLSLLAHAGLGAGLWEVPPPDPPAKEYELVIDMPEEEEEDRPPVDTREEKPPPDPAPQMKTATAPAPREAPAPPPAEDAPPAAPAAPLATDVQMGNGDGPPGGVRVSPPAPARPAPAAATPAEKPARAGGSAPGCSEEASKPKPSSRPRDIEYLDDARAREVEGRLVLAVRVAPDGSVAGVEVKSPVDPALDAAAVEAVRTWRFDPARRCGTAVEGTFTLARRFVLGD